MDLEITECLFIYSQCKTSAINSSNVQDKLSSDLLIAILGSKISSCRNSDRRRPSHVKVKNIITKRRQTEFSNACITDRSSPFVGWSSHCFRLQTECFPVSGSNSNQPVNKCDPGVDFPADRSPPVLHVVGVDFRTHNGSSVGEKSSQRSSTG